MSMRVVLADDHAILRHGLGQGLRQEAGIEIVGEASDGRSTVEIA